MASCAVCGGKVGGLLKDKLGNGLLLCRTCANKVPSKYYGDMCINWNLEDYYSFVQAQANMNELRRVFKPDIEFGRLRIDTERGLFTVSSPRDKEWEVYEFKNVRFHKFTVQLFDYYKILLKKEYCVSVHVYLSFAMKDRMFFGAEKLLEMHDNVPPKQMDVENFGDNLKKFRKIEEIFENSVYQVCPKLKQSNNVYTRKQYFRYPDVEKAMSLYQVQDLKQLTEEELEQKRIALHQVFDLDQDAEEGEFKKKIEYSFIVLMMALAQTRD
ncbi:hypothetical protein [Clostridium sp.]